MRPLQSLRNAGLRGTQIEATRERDEAKARRAWSLCVGEAMQRQTAFLRLAQGRVVIGVWDLGMIPSLRLAATAAWPDLRPRLERLTKLRLTGIELVPMDPPPPQIPRAPAPKDAFAEALKLLRKHTA